MSQPAIAVLASGQGTTAEAFIRAGQQNPDLPQITLVITNNKMAGILDRITRLNEEFGLAIKTKLISKFTHPAAEGEEVSRGCQTKAEEMATIDALKECGCDAVVLMGYMKKTGPQLVHEFGWRPDYISPYQARMLNTHPGLLPETKGLMGVHVQEFVLANKLKRAGQTLHVVSEDYDEGPTVVENLVEVLPADTADSLFERVQQTEKQHLPGDIAEFISKRNEYIKEIS